MEFLKSDEEGNRFFIEKGEPYRTGFFGLRKYAWETVKDNNNRPISFDTMDKAVLAVKELQTQLPIYHEIK
jgi:hypothetical protein